MSSAEFARLLRDTASPRLTNDMDRGSLLHKLLLGAGREVAVIECDDWKKPGNRELRDIQAKWAELVGAGQVLLQMMQAKHDRTMAKWEGK